MLAAKRAYKRLDLASQYQLCHEIADTRGAELVLAYHNLISVGFGFKTSQLRSRHAAEHVDVRRPCIVFVVSRKWRTKNNAWNVQALPSQLLAYTTLDGERVLCAVPTDVKTQSSLGARPRAHGDEDAECPFGVAVENDKDGTWGAVTCAIRRPADPATLYALGCRHVFSLTLTGSETASGCSVRPSGRDTILGTTTSIRGRLDPGATDNLDAQLAKVTNAGALRAALSGMRFDPNDPFARGPHEMPRAGFWILTPREDARGNRLKVWVQLRNYVNQSIYYNGVAVMHKYIIHAEASDELGSGDSGSPAVLVAVGRKLLGMYIGGDGTNAYILPAWQLVQGAYYGRLGESLWTVVNA